MSSEGMYCLCGASRPADCTCPPVLKGEVRFTSGTGGEKGRKPEVYSLVPWEAMDEIARVYAYGAEKYNRDNWRKGYPWSWSYDALIRHISAFWRGEDNDPESGHPHLAHAAFHILALLWWQKFGKGVDDRFPKEEKKKNG